MTYQPIMTPVSYHVSYPQQPLPQMLSLQEPVIKKEVKKRRKMADKGVTADKKKPRVIGQGSLFDVTSIDAVSESTECVKCHRKKCFKHFDANKNKNQLSKKTPEDVVLQMKKHMLKILTLTNLDYTSICKTDAKSGQVDIDMSKTHRSYLEEHEPLAFSGSLNEPSKDYKPKVKQWLYRKIFLDEFKTLEYQACKRHIGELRRTLEAVMVQKKKKVTKPKPATVQQVLPQDYSLNNHVINGSVDMGRTTVVGPGGLVTTSHGTPVSSAPVGYQVCYFSSVKPDGNLMNLGMDGTPVSSMGASATATLHNSLATYMTQQVPPNLLFGLQQQQQTPPAPPAQQHPLNLQTSHPSSMGGPNSANPSPAATLPLNLHNPYYVSLGPMLPLSMSAANQQHNAALPQQYQHGMLQQHSLQGSFNQHTMYQ